ncbi:MAG: PEP-CTERM sorting domain-containing protein [Acidobacteria bacterium]|nr:PEP-CTERM sorting domain-containing protein [Acidobacteriota bacterium]
MSNLNGPQQRSSSSPSRVAGSFIRAFALSLAAGSVALAGVVFDSGPTEFNGAGWYLADSGKISQQFSLSEPSLLMSFTFSTLRSQFGPGATFVNWEISKEAMGVKSLAKGTSSVSNQYIGASGNGYVYFATTASLPDVKLNAGDYWLTLQTDRGSDGAYINSAVRYGSGGFIRTTFCCDYWYDASVSGGQLPLQISGTTLAPEPGTMGLFGASLAGAVVFLRRRRA